MLAINTTETESTGYSPAYLTQGRIPRLPKALYDEVTIGTGAHCPNPDERANELKEVFQIVRSNLQKAAQKQKHHYDLRRRSWKTEFGDQVLVRQHPLSKAIDNFAAKLAPKFGGPFIVMGFSSPIIVRLRDVGTSEQRTAHLSELKPYHNANRLFSLLSFRSPKHIANHFGKKMDMDKQKFEKFRKKFRENMEKERAKTRRTIFLNDDDYPKSSTNNARTRCQSRHPSSQEYPKPKRKPPQPTRAKTNTAHHRRVIVVKGPLEGPIYISDDEEKIPPSPPLVLPEETPVEIVEVSIEEVDDDEPPPPPRWDEQYLTLEDININHEDLDDPLIQEFVRAFCGEMTTTVDIRLTTLPYPSPSISPSSIDWESENFRPPIPPRRRMYGTFDVEDKQFPFLGMQCYERVWRARILTPKIKTNPALVGFDQPIPPQYSAQGLDQTPISPIRWHKSEEREVPITPGRSWLDPATFNDTTSSNATTKHQRPSREAPKRTPSPADLQMSPQLPVMTHDKFDMEQLPIDLQREIAEKQQKYKGIHTRFSYAIHGQQYRITISRNGTVRQEGEEENPIPGEGVV